VQPVRTIDVAMLAIGLLLTAALAVLMIEAFRRSRQGRPFSGTLKRLDLRAATTLAAMLGFAAGLVVGILLGYWFWPTSAEKKNTHAMLLSPLCASAFKRGSGGNSLFVEFLDSTTRAPETGVTASTPGLAVSYVKQNFAPTSVTIVNLADHGDPHTEWGLIHLGHGVYRLDVADIVFEDFVDHVDLIGTASGMIMPPQRLKIVDDSLDRVLIDIWSAVRTAELDQAETALQVAALNAAPGIILQNVPAMFTWRLGNRADGTYVPAEPVSIVSGESPLVAFDFSELLAPGQFLASVTPPVASSSLLTPGAVLGTDYGFDSRLFKFVLAVDAAATAGLYSVSAIVTTNAAQQYAVKGSVRVIAA